MRLYFNNYGYVLLDGNMTYDEYKKIPNRRPSNSKYGDRVLVKGKLITSNKKIKRILNNEDLKEREKIRNRILILEAKIGKYYTDKYDFDEEWDSDWTDEDEQNLTDEKEKLIEELFVVKKARRLSNRLFVFDTQKLKEILNTAGFDFPISLEKGYIISYTDENPKVELKKSVSLKF